MKLWMGLKDLLVDTVEKTTILAQDAHSEAARRTFGYLKFVPGLAGPAAVIEALDHVGTTLAYKNVRFVNRLVSGSLDTAYGALVSTGVVDERHLEGSATPMRSDAVGTSAWIRDSALGALNGVVGDTLAERESPLAFDMTLRQDGERVDLDAERLRQVFESGNGTLCLFIHGLACTEWSWNLNADMHYGDASVNYGSQLHEDLGYTPLYLRYNTGLHVSQNGQQLAALLETLVAVSPKPIRQIVLVGHSMGGLVARSACHYGSEREHAWSKSVRHIFCLGSPHLGTPLEKAGNALTTALHMTKTAGAQIPARVIDARSAGIKDLRYGYLVDEDWLGMDIDAPFKDRRRAIPFLEHATYYFVAGTLSESAEHPLGHLLGDWLVRVPSASGYHSDDARRVPFAPENGEVVGGISHTGLANHPTVYAHIKRWCETGEQEERKFKAPVATMS